MLMFALLAHAVDLDTQLASRDSVSCASLGVADAALRDALIAHTDPLRMPPWAPIRAASCLIELFPADPVTHTTVLPWMTDPDRAGLALVVAQKIDLLPVPVATELAVAAMAGPEGSGRDRLRRRLLKSARPEVLAVVPPDPPAPVTPAPVTP